MIKRKAFVYGLCNVYYDSYYIQGLRDSGFNVEFNCSRFPSFKQGSFAVILIEGEKKRKIVIDSRDSSEVCLEAYRWCDFYGKVNFSMDTDLFDLHKLLPIGPSFGIRIWGFTKTIYFALRNFFIFKRNIKDKRDFIANYWRQYKRLPISDYSVARSSSNKVFFISSIWKKEIATNQNRAAFIRACKQNFNVEFEGGFAPRKDGNNIVYEDLIFDGRVSLSDYIKKIKKSAFVFNTPAVLSCHGWKLAEFLALGKAIISTQHTNIMPQEMVDYVHLCYVSNLNEINSRINLLIDDKKLRNKIEENSRKYFEENLMPKVIISKLFN